MFPTLALHDHDPKTTAYEHKDDTEIQQVTNTSYSVLQPCSPHWPCTTTTFRPPRMSTKMTLKFSKKPIRHSPCYSSVPHTRRPRPRTPDHLVTFCVTAVFPTLALHDHDPKTTAYEHKDDTEIQQVTKTSYSVLQPCSPHWPCTTTTSRPPRMSTRMAPRISK
ncbi:hypothetical protein J6590_056789 [Homalodisca vitripennis]|nr:hypothetical protein J6590_056789 [Homalodisca vitripennis]